MAKLLTKDQILAAQDIKDKVVDVPEWGGAVRLRGLTAAQRDHFTQSISKGKGRDKDFSLDNIRANFVARHILGEDNKPMFTPKELGEKSSAVIERLYDECAALSGMSDEHLKELTKNSLDGQSDDSPSD